VVDADALARSAAEDEEDDEEEDEDEVEDAGALFVALGRGC